MKFNFLPAYRRRICHMMGTLKNNKLRQFLLLIAIVVLGLFVLKEVFMNRYCWSQVEPGLNMTLKRNSSLDIIHVVLSTDENQLPGVPTVINSVLAHTKNPVQFHIVVSKVSVSSYLKCFTFVDEPLIHEVKFPHHLLDETYKGYMQAQAKKQKAYLSSYGNYARLFIHRLLPDVDRVIYLDNDLVVQRDLAKLWKLTLKHRTVLSAAGVRSPKDFNKLVWEKFKERHGIQFDDTNLMEINIGVFVANLKRWREIDKQTDDEIHFWMKQGTENNLWKVGTQPLMILGFHNEWTRIDRTWNELNFMLGTDAERDQAAILHFPGPNKIWTEKSSPASYWRKMNPRECNGKDEHCTLNEDDQRTYLYLCSTDC